MDANDASSLYQSTSKDLMRKLSRFKVFFKSRGFTIKKYIFWQIQNRTFISGWQIVTPAEPHHILICNKKINKNINDLEVTNNGPNIFACLIFSNASKKCEVTRVWAA